MQTEKVCITLNAKEGVFCGEKLVTVPRRLKKVKAPCGDCVVSEFFLNVVIMKFR